MEIFISGSQVCEKKNIFELGPFQELFAGARLHLGE